MTTMDNNNDFIQVNGIMSQGYGFSPKAVMRDKRLTIEAKAIYSYMSSFAGAGLSSFPSVKLQLHDLCISEKRYYKHRKLLEDLGYITIKQTRIRRDDGKVVNDKNIYTLEQFPTPKPKEEIEKDKKENNNSEDSQNDSTDKNGMNTSFSENSHFDCSQNDSVQNVGSNNNNLNNNNLNNNNNISSSNEDGEEERKNEVIKLLQICQNNKFKLKKTDIKELLVIYDFSKIAKAIITASSTESKIKNYKGYLVAVLNDMDKIKKVDINISKLDKKLSREPNFTQRDDNYDDLERKLLGWEK